MPWTSDARRAPGPASYVPGAMFVVHGADGLPVLDAAANGIARHDGVMRLDRSGTVSDPGHARVPVPGDGRLLDVGWTSARDRAWDVLMATSHDMLRLPLLKRAAERWQERVARTSPEAVGVWCLEDNGIDLFVVEWTPDPANRDRSGELDRMEFRHYQYQDANPRHPCRLIAQSESPEHVRTAVRGADDGALLSASLDLVETYEGVRDRNGGLAPRRHRLVQHGVIRRDGAALLGPDGTPVPDLRRIVADETVRTLAASLSDASWPSVSLPRDFIHPYTRRTADGREWEKMIVALPPGTRMDGRRLGGWMIDRFVTDAVRRDLASGDSVSIRFRPGTPIRLFRGRGRNRRTLTVGDPGRLCIAINAAQSSRPVTRINRPTEMPPPALTRGMAR